MLKQIVLATLVATSLNVMADNHEQKAKEKKDYYIGFGGTFEDNKDGSDAYKGSIKFGKQWNDWFATELYTRLKKKDAGSSDQRVEVAAIPSYKLTDDLSAYTRLSLGEKYDPTEHYSYWGIEPGVKYKLNSDWSIKTGVRFRDAWGEEGQKDITYKAGLGYKLTDDTSVSFNYAEKHRDKDTQEFGIGYTIKF
jgi:hypothetical protein